MVVPRCSAPTPAQHAGADFPYMRGPEPRLVAGEATRRGRGLVTCPAIVVLFTGTWGKLHGLDKTSGVVLFLCLTS
jgi:hypothetical protein